MWHNRHFSFKYVNFFFSITRWGLSLFKAKQERAQQRVTRELLQERLKTALHWGMPAAFLAGT